MNKLYKRFSAIFITIILFTLSFTPLYAKSTSSYNYSDERVISEATHVLDNGLTLTIIVTEENVPSSARAAAYTKSGSKHCVVNNDYGEELFRFTVSGVFTVTAGVRAVCTSASYSTSISDDAWELDSASAYASGNQAVGNATFISKVLFVTVDSADCNVTLTCDADGSIY